MANARREQPQDAQAGYGYTLLGIGLIALVLVAVFFIGRAILDFLTSASPQLGSAIIGTGGIVTVAVVANVWSKGIEHRRAIQQEQRTKKAEVYEEFMKFWFRLLTGKESEQEESSEEFQKEVDDYVRGFTNRLATWGSEPFLKEYITFKEKINQDEGGALLDFENVLLAIRADLGYKNKGLERGDLLKIFLDEEGIDTLVTAEAANASEITQDRPSENGKTGDLPTDRQRQ